MAENFEPDIQKGKIRYVIAGAFFLVALICIIGVGRIFLEERQWQHNIDSYRQETDSEEQTEEMSEKPIVTTPQYLTEISEETQQTEESISTYQVIVGDYTWEQAKQYCEQNGGYLATVTSEAEQEEIESILYFYIEQSDISLYAVWLGASDTQETGKFAWITGESFSSYQKWADGEPNNENGTEHYLIMYNVSPQEQQWFWNDAPNDVSGYYSGTMGFIMEKDAGT